MIGEEQGERRKEKGEMVCVGVISKFEN